MRRSLTFLFCLILISLPFQAKASTTKNIRVSITIPERKKAPLLSTKENKSLTEETIRENKYQSRRINRNGKKIILETVTLK